MLFRSAGYRRHFSVGLVAAGGGLGILIPPSVPLIVYATIAEISVGDVFLAALGPGLLLGLVFCGFVIAMGDRMRDREDQLQIATAGSSRELLAKLGRAAPVVALPFVILGGIYGGVFTPSEAAAVAVIYSVGLAFTFYREPDMDGPVAMFADAGRLSAAILLIMAATSVFAYAVTLNQVPLQVAETVETWGLSLVIVLLCINLLVLALGCFLEIISVILITAPIFLPVVTKLGMDPIHFGLLLVLNMELAVITPPIGMNLFVISAISDVPLLRVFRGTLPFVALIAVMLIFITYSETLALALFRLLQGI